MKLKFIVLIIFAVLAALFIIGAIPRPRPEGLNLTVSEAISPYVQVFVLDTNKNAINSLETNVWFFFKQTGLAEGTTYGFRIISENGSVLMPVYETFTAKAVDWIEQNEYYYGLTPGEYTVELLTIEEDKGTIVARTNLSIFNAQERYEELERERMELQNMIVENCSYLMNEPEIDADGWSRGYKVAKCVSEIASQNENIDACDTLIQRFNMSTVEHEECIRTYAITTGDLSVCEKMSMPKGRGFCKAKAAEDWTECRKITCDISCAMEALDVQQDLCIQWYAIETGNNSLCDEITSTAYDMKNICYNLTSQE